MQIELYSLLQTANMVQEAQDWLLAVMKNIDEKLQIKTKEQQVAMDAPSAIDHVAPVLPQEGEE